MMYCLLRTHGRGAPTTIAKTEGRRHRTSQSSPGPERPVKSVLCLSRRCWLGLLSIPTAPALGAAAPFQGVAAKATERSRLSGSDPGVICLNDSPALVAAEAAYAALGKGEDELREWAVVYLARSVVGDSSNYNAANGRGEFNGRGNGAMEARVQTGSGESVLQFVSDVLRTEGLSALKVRSICGKGGVAFAEFVITRTLPDSEETCSEVSIHQWKTDSAGKVVSFQTFAMQPGERCWY